MPTTRDLEAELDQRLRKAAPQGTSEGSFFVPEDYLKVPVLQ